MLKILCVQRSYLKNVLPILHRRLVSTSKRNNESVTAEVCKTKPGTKEVTHKDWISYGFHYRSKAEDRNAMHSVLFVSITLCMVVTGFYWAYLPDYNLRDWSQREAFLELRRREQNGLPLIDPNYIDPAKVVLPSDQDLGDTEIII